MIKLDKLRFWVERNGVNVFVGEEQVARLDPSESLALLEYLELNREEFNRAIAQKGKPRPSTVGWEMQKVGEAFDNMPE